MPPSELTEEEPDHRLKAEVKTYAVHEHHNYHFEVHVRMTNLTAYTVL